MNEQVLGSQSTDSPKTPTLRQYYKQKGGAVPKTSFVKLIFNPGKYGGYSLTTDHNFRVSILEDNPLHGYLTDHLVIHADNEDALFVRILDGGKGSFELYVSDSETASWEEKQWGFLAKINQKTETKKKPRQPKEPS